MTERAMGCFFKHIHIQCSPMRDLFISLNTHALHFLLFPHVGISCKAVSVCTESLCLSCQHVKNVLIVMKHREAGLLGDDGKRQRPLTSALSPLWRHLGKTDV